MGSDEICTLDRPWSALNKTSNGMIIMAITKVSSNGCKYSEYKAFTLPFLV